MSRRPHTIIECHDYALPPEFPVYALEENNMCVSDAHTPALHFHNSLEIGLCHSGSGTLEFQDTKYNFKAGDVTLIASGTPHIKYSAPGTFSSWSYLFLNLVWLAGLSTRDAALPEMYEGFRYNSKLIVTQEQDPILAPLVKEIVNEMICQNTSYRHCVIAFLDALLGKLSRYMPKDDAAHQGIPFPIAPALHYIDLHYMDDFRVDDLASLCRMSTSYFRRIFTETMGIGPLAHLNRTRIMHACTLLQMTDRSILEICGAVGFLSLSSFNRHFSTMMGQPPTAWRHAVSTDQPYVARRHAGHLALSKSESRGFGST